MSHPSVLIVHESDDVLARSVASFTGCPVRLVTAREAASAQRQASDDLRLVVADVANAKWAGSFTTDLRGSGRLPALALLASFESEPQAFQAGAAALVTHPLAPAEAQALAALANAGGALTSLCDALAQAQHPGGSTRALEMLAVLIGHESGAALAWAQYHAAALLLTEGKLQEALEDLSALVDEQPAFWRAHERLAAVWDVAGDPDAARKARETSVQIRERLVRDSDAALAAHPEAMQTVREAGGRATTEAGGVPEAASPAAAGADVVIADDSELVREMLADVLIRAGYSVRQASTGTEAVELARKKRPDLMILDGLMPGKTGFDTCKEVKEVLYPSNPPKVLIFSAIYTKQRQRSEAVSIYKVDEVLAKPTDKPLDEAEMLATVRRHLGQ